MQNLEQIRARNAFAFAKTHGQKIVGPHGGQVIKKLPSHILNHGLLATAAYSFGEKEGWQLTFDAIAKHLSDPDVGILPASVKNRHSLMDELSNPNATSETLKLATSETMAWLQYARRFVNKEDNQQ